MATGSQRPKAQNNVLSALDMGTQTLSLAKNVCGIPPTQMAFGSAGALPATIRVCWLPFRDFVLPVDVHSGLYGQRTGLRGAWANPRRRVKFLIGVWTGNNRMDSVGPCSQLPAYNVSRTTIAHSQ